MRASVTTSSADSIRSGCLTASTSLCQRVLHGRDRLLDPLGQPDEETDGADGEQRDDDGDPGGHDALHTGAQVTERPLASSGQHAAQRGRDAAEEVRDAGEVAEQVVAVEADERQQLLDHLKGARDDHGEEQTAPLLAASTPPRITMKTALK